MSDGSETTYNGWTNYETWCVSLWLDNDEGTYNEVRTLVPDAEDIDEGAAYQLAKDVKYYVEELPEVVAVTEGPATFVVDLLGAALSAVNWHEIAENLIQEVGE